jgi:Ca2+-binding RTX toxin-like protein
MSLTRELVSQTSNGTLGNGASGSISASLLDNETHLDISTNGRFVVFESLANNFAVGVTDNNSKSDIFVKDMQTGELKLVSSKTDGSLLSTNSDAISPEVSDDGRYVVFQNAEVIYHKDLSTGTLSIVSVSHLNGSDGDGKHPSMSADGRYVVYDSGNDTSYTNQVVDGTVQVFLRDMQNPGNSLMLSKTAAGVEGNSESSQAHISDDGKFVVFESSASNLFADDTNNKRDILLKDLASQEIMVVSKSQSGVLSNGISYNPMLSANGRYVVFESYATNLLDGISLQNDNKAQLYRKDLQTGEVKLVSVKDDNQTINNQNSFKPVISADGRYVVFYDGAGSNLSDTIGITTYLKDMQTGTLTELNPRYTASQNAQVQFSAQVDQYAFSADGRYLVLATKQANMLNSPTGADAELNVFRYDLSSITGNNSGGNDSSTEGNDVLLSGPTAETFDGKGGIDTIDYSAVTKAVKVDLSKGTASGGGGNDKLSHIENITGSNFNDQLSGDGNDNLIDGGLGKDTLKGAAGNDTLNGGDGNDVLQGDAGADILDGGTGNDKMIGGKDNDTYYVDSLKDSVVETASGGAADTAIISVDKYLAAANLEILTIASDAGAIGVTGNKSSNTISGNAAANKLDGKEGADVLQGGEGDDIFIFSSKLGSQNIDSIADFSEGDRIQLSKKIFSKAVADADDLIPLDGRNLDGNDLVVGASLAEAKSLRVGELANAHFLFDTSNQALYYDADGLGVKEGLQFVTLTGVTSLQAEDLFIF